MSAVPSIIVLVITALLVFRRELITHATAPVPTPTPTAKRRLLRQSKAGPRRNLDPRKNAGRQELRCATKLGPVSGNEMMIYTSCRRPRRSAAYPTVGLRG
jgi:hypothetical protein